MTRFSTGVLYAAALVTGMMVAGELKAQLRRPMPRPPRRPEPRPGAAPMAPPPARYTPEGATIH